jgi:tetratricopeptide (TPR) repeat protein
VHELLLKAESLRKRSRYREALRLLKRALKGSEGEDRLECLLAAGDTCRMTGDFTGAGGYYEEAVGLSRELKEPLQALDASVGLALARRALGDWKGSLGLLSRAEKAYLRRGDAEGAAFSLWAKAGALRVKGDIPGAVKTFREAKARFGALGDERGVGYSLCGMGGTSRVRGDFGRSLKYYTEANALFGKLRDGFGTAYSHCGIGNALRMRGEFKGAREHFRRAVAVYRRIGDVVSYSYTLWSLGKMHMMTGKYGLSEKYVKEALGHFRKTRDPRGAIYCRLSQAELRRLGGGKAAAGRMLVAARREARAFGFAVEECHAGALLSSLEGRTDNSCYGKLGLGLRYGAIPFNIP